MSFTLEFINNIKQLPLDQWQAFDNIDTPFQSYSFLLALEQNQCVGGQTGWRPHHLIVKEAERIVAAIPMYEKQHSYGEYVFDFAWAEAYQRHQMSYYPKLVASIPFTPVTGNRVLSVANVNPESLFQSVCQFIQQHLEQSELSSVHWLFPELAQQQQLTSTGQLARSSVQFEWRNRGYDNFEQFLQTFTSRKRKNVKKERQKISQQQIKIQRLHGQSLTPEAMVFFSTCYQQTYLKRSGHHGYLNQEFFMQLLDTMADSLLLVQAEYQQQPIASALYLYNQKGLFGRYWGALEEFDGLHFECCYYQGIEFAIEKQLAYFNPGTQGEHKILRGFEPKECFSSHWLKDEEFHQAVSRFLIQEKPQIKLYKQNCENILPYKK